METSKAGVPQHSDTPTYSRLYVVAGLQAFGVAYLKESHFLLEVCYGPTKGRHEDQPVVAMTKPPQSWFSALHHRNSLQADVNCLGFAANEIDTSNVGSLDSSLGRAVGCVLDKCQQKWGWKPLLTGEGGTSLFSGIVPFRRVITYFRLLECNGVLYAVLFGWGAPLFPGIVLSVFFWFLFRAPSTRKSPPKMM